MISLHNSGNNDIYITGSNAFLISSDLTTLFTVRFIEILIYPFSISEYMLYFSDSSDKESLFGDYTMKGGLSGFYVYSNEIDRQAYIKDVFKTIINRDFVDKYHLSETMELDKLTEFMMDNISNLSSPNNISNTLCLNEITTNHVTIGKYIKYLCSAFIFKFLILYPI